MCVGNACGSSGGGGGSSSGGGSSGSDGGSDGDPSNAPFYNTCISAANKANALDGSTVLSRDEFQAHTNEYTKAACPDVPEPLQRHNYFDDTHFTDTFAAVSCYLCLGAFDPFNPDAVDYAQDQDGSACGCETDSSTNKVVGGRPFDITIQTVPEMLGYCAIVLDMVTVQCLQPVPSCLETCQTQYNSCESSCEETGERDDFLNCWNTCMPPYFECLEDCDSLIDDDEGMGTANFGSGGNGQPNDGAVTKGDDGNKTPNGGGDDDGESTASTSAASLWALLFACVTLAFVM